MGNIESLIFMQYIYIYEQYIIEFKKYYSKNDNNKNDKNDNKNNYINYCHICNKNLSNQCIYRGNDLSFCSEQHRNILNI